MTSYSDRLAQSVREFGPLCVGLDPRVDSLPTSLRTTFSTPAEAVEAFCVRCLDLCRPYSGVVKPQAAFFELLGAEGMTVMGRVISKARECGYFVILDAKRGDIASTAEAYADAAFRVWKADALTVNPYLGRDAIEPFIRVARETGGGLFVLVRTSNPGASLFQNLNCEGQPLYRHVAKAVDEWNAAGIGATRLGDVGAVVGATHPQELVELRAALPNCWLLVPGYGAQGGTAADVKAAYRPDGLGAIVNSSRGVTFPFKPDDADWESKIVAAAKKAQMELR
ncbi:MAG: orotidine-5'-phosphate decarboxylase [Gemmataceae bacterium]